MQGYGQHGGYSQMNSGYGAHDGINWAKIAGVTALGVMGIGMLRAAGASARAGLASGAERASVAGGGVIDSAKGHVSSGRARIASRAQEAREYPRGRQMLNKPSPGARGRARRSRNARRLAKRGPRYTGSRGLPNGMGARVASTGRHRTTLAAPTGRQGFSGLKQDMARLGNTRVGRAVRGAGRAIRDGSRGIALSAMMRRGASTASVGQGRLTSTMSRPGGLGARGMTAADFVDYAPSHLTQRPGRALGL